MGTAPRERPRNSGDTKLELLLAAEKLFGERGMEASSLREIAAKAGQGNTNAVKYHFGSLDGLLDAIFDYRVGQMEGPRGAMLEHALETSRTGDARLLLEILCLPHLDIVDDEGRHSYASFMLRSPQSYIAAGRLEETVQRWPNLNRVQELLLRRIDYVPREIAKARVQTCMLMFLGVIARFDRMGGFEKNPDGPIVLDDVLEMATAGLCAPFRESKGSRGYPSEACVSGWRKTT